MGRLARFLGLEPSPVVQARAPIGTRVLTATDGRDILLNDPDGWEVERPWLWWMGPAGSDGTGGPFGNPPPGADDGRWGAGTLPAVSRCTSIIVDTIAGLPWQVRRGWELLDRPAWIDDPQALRQDGRILGASVDEVRLSAVEFWAQWLCSALWFGDGYVYVPVRDSGNAPKPPLWVLNPADVEIRGQAYYARGADVPFGPGEILHLRGEAPYLGGHGTGVIDKHGAELGLAAATRDFAANAYRSGVPAGYLKVAAPMVTQDQADDLKARWMAAHGSTRRSIAVLNATTEFHPIALSPIDGQLDAAREWSLRDIAIAFGVPPYMLGVPGDSSTYANVESRMIELRTFSLLPWIRRAESCLDAQLPRGTSLKITTDATLRADTKTRFEAYQIAVQNGWLTVDEVRELEDRAPLSGGAGPPAAPVPPPAADVTPPEPTVAPMEVP